MKKYEIVKKCENCRFSKHFYLYEYKSIRCLNNYSKYYEEFKKVNFKCNKWELNNEKI